MEQFIQVSAIQAKLKKHTKNRIIYIHAVTGYGKTTAVKLFLENTPYSYLPGEELTTQTMPSLSALMNTMVVIDDVQWILNDEIREQVRELCRQKKNSLILISRSPLPHWLTDLALEKCFLQCTNSDLVFGEEEIAQLAERMDLTVPEKIQKFILKESMGNAAGVQLCLMHVEAGDDLTDTQVQENIWKELYDYIDRVCYAQWDEKLQKILLLLGNFDSFSLEMAEQITGQRDMGRIVQYANTMGSFLYRRADGNWEMLPMFLKYLRYKCAMLYSQEDFNLLYRQAAAWYEGQNVLERALYYYEKVGDTAQLTRLLTKNAMLHPGVADFYKYRRYYQGLSRETIQRNPVLMAGIAMLSSILLIPEEAEHWYSQLEQYEKKSYRTKEERQEARVWLAYLDISLPHRGTKDMVEIFKNTVLLVTQGEMTLPEFSATSNLPSIMYGGKDFCAWSKIDSRLAVVLKEPLELVLGKSGKGLVNIALAESGFEKDTMTDYELQTRLSTGYMMAEAGGTIEMCFVSIGVLIRYHVSKGQIDVAKNQLDSFLTKVEREQAHQLLENVKAMSVWLALLQGNVAAAQNWLPETRNEISEFCTMNRYQFLQKLRCYLALERYQEAIILAEKLQFYFREYKRTHDLLECSLLKAILLYRIGNSGWQQSLKLALEIGEEYHFIFAVAQEGCALLPLLNELEKVSAPFFKEVKRATEQMARLYPAYLKTAQQPIEELTEKEAEILKLLRQGLSTGQICEICDITYNSLKFHNKNIYRKLGVTSRQEAERRAMLLDL